MRTKLHLALLLLLPITTNAQQPTLDQVLTKVHENFRAYLNTLPNLYAEEHLTADLTRADGPSLRNSTDTTYDSTFRLRRSTDPSQLAGFIESRQIQQHDHRPATDASLAVPVLVKNAFSYAAAFFSPALKPCYDYKLETNRRLKKQPVLILSYSLRSKIAADAKCPVREHISGRAFIDPATLQIIRIEQKRPEYPLTSSFLATAGGPSASTTIGSTPPGAGSRWDETTTAEPGPTTSSQALGSWEWSIDYAPVLLNAQTYYLPATITSTIISYRFPRAEWLFVATYANYHLLYVTENILPGYKPAKPSH